MFRVSTTPIIRSTQNCNYSLRYCAATSLQASLATLEGGSCTVPKAVVTVLRTPDDGCGWHPKHVQWTRRIINRLLCVASRWSIINIANVYLRSDLKTIPNEPLCLSIEILDKGHGTSVSCLSTSKLARNTQILFLELVPGSCQCER